MSKSSSYKAHYKLEYQSIFSLDKLFVTAQKQRDRLIAFTLENPPKADCSCLPVSSPPALLLVKGILTCGERCKNLQQAQLIIRYHITESNVFLGQFQEAIILRSGLVSSRVMWPNSCL